MCCGLTHHIRGIPIVRFKGPKLEPQRASRLRIAAVREDRRQEGLVEVLLHAPGGTRGRPMAAMTGLKRVSVNGMIERRHAHDTAAAPGPSPP